MAGNWANAAFAAFNAMVASWAIVAYIGIGNTLIDTWHGLTNWLYVEVKPKTSTTARDSNNGAFDWQAVLYHGNTKESVPFSVRDQFLYSSLGSKGGRQA